MRNTVQWHPLYRYCVTRRPARENAVGDFVCSTPRRYLSKDIIWWPSVFISEPATFSSVHPPTNRTQKFPTESTFQEVFQTASKKKPLHTQKTIMNQIALTEAFSLTLWTYEPMNPGTQEPMNPGTHDPRDPWTQRPMNPGTHEPRDPWIRRVVPRTVQNEILW